ncbi:MAG: hypothetical protein SCM11_08355 [Bacillota bacterium]|nr:hypothetical protein [Bacillota bacterium]
MVIDDFSTRTAGDLSIIAFNYDTSEILQNSPVRIKIVYAPEREPEPTPTPWPVETTDPVTADPDGSCFFGYVSKSSGSRTVYSKHFGTYQVLKEDSIKKGRLSISENGTKLPDTDSTLIKRKAVSRQNSP